MLCIFHLFAKHGKAGQSKRGAAVQSLKHRMTGLLHGERRFSLLAPDPAILKPRPEAGPA
jgi:hypothetical protein